MLQLILSCAVFLLLHLWVSGTPLRDRLVVRLGEGPYLGLFSLASVVVLVWMLMAYGAARSEGPHAVWWGPTPLTLHIQLVLMLVAFLLAVPGLLTRNPGSVGQTGALDDPDPVRGVLRITRHPFLWGVAIWSAGRRASTPSGGGPMAKAGRPSRRAHPSCPSAPSCRAGRPCGRPSLACRP